MGGIKKLLTLVISLFLLAFFTSSAFPAKPIIIGSPLSTAFLYGWDAERGIKLAVEEINKKGGVRIGNSYRPFKVEVIDTRDLEPGVPISEALMAVEKLILEKKADFLIGGPVRSEAALAAMDLASRYKKVTIITTGVLTPKYHRRIAQNYDKYKYCFRITSDIIQLGKETMEVLKEIAEKYKFNRVFIMVQDVAHARKAGEFMKKLLIKAGWKVVGHEVYPTGATDFSLGLLEAKRKKAEILFIWMDMPETAILLKQWSDLKLKALPIGFMCAAEQPGFWKATKGRCAYTVVNVVNGGNAPSNITPWTMKFIKAYKKKWGLEPEGYGTSSSYMAVYVLKDAIERAGSLDPDKVVKALEETDMMGVYGRIRFDKRSHQIIASYNPKEGALGCIFQWQNGKRVTFFPKAGAIGTLQLPPWMR